MKNQVYILFFSGLICYNKPTKAQRFSLALEQAVERATNISLDKKINDYSLQSFYWDYNAFKASLKPTISLSSTVPNYTRTFSSIIQPNGTSYFILQNQSYSTLNLNVSQYIGATGGTLSVYSSLNRIDLFGDVSSHQYSTLPVSISYNQNTLLFNPLKWQKKIFRLQKDEATKGHLEGIENISINTVERYFELLILQAQVSIDKQNCVTADTLLKIVQTKFSIGTRDKNDLLQAKLNLLTAENYNTQDHLALEDAHQNLINYLLFKASDSLLLTIPSAPANVLIDTKEAIEKAYSNRKKIVEFRRRRMELQKDSAQVKASTNPTVSIFGSFGLSQTNQNIEKSYQNLQQHQTIAVQLTIPLIDWGVNKSKRKKNITDIELLNTTIEQEKLAFEQEISLQVAKWNTALSNLNKAEEINNIAAERYEISRLKFISGNITNTDFSYAQQQKDLAAITFINNLKNCWILYYTIRKLTLYDFEKHIPLSE